RPDGGPLLRQPAHGQEPWRRNTRPVDQVIARLWVWVGRKNFNPPPFPFLPPPSSHRRKPSSSSAYRTIHYQDRRSRSPSSACSRSPALPCRPPESAYLRSPTSDLSQPG